MCNLLGLYLQDGVSLTYEMKRLIYSAQVQASTIHKDGWGYFAYTRDGETFSRKSAASMYGSGYSEDIFDLPENTEYVMIHTRRTSSGDMKAPEDKNSEEYKKYLQTLTSYSHPFISDNLVLMHNGTLKPAAGEYFDMDSKYLAEKLSENLRQHDLARALEESFKSFEAGLASLLLAIYENGRWVPYIMKGNKPLNRFRLDGAELIITDDNFLLPFLRVYSKIFNAKFEDMGLITTQGIWQPHSDVPLVQKSYIHNYVTRTVKTSYVGGVSPRKSKTNVPKSDSSFDKFVSSRGLAVLIDVTIWILTKLSYGEVRTLIDLQEEEVLTIVNHIADHEYDVVKGLLNGESV